MQMCRVYLPELTELTQSLGFLAVDTNISKLHRCIARALHMYAFMTEQCLKIN